jgi:hypothetical protein
MQIPADQIKPLPEPAPKPTPGTEVTLFEHADHGGRSQSFPVGRYDIDQLVKERRALFGVRVDVGVGNDTVSSLKVPWPLMVTLYADRGFSGGRYVSIADESFIGDRFNDLTSSLEVSPRAPAPILFSDADLTGHRVMAPVGHYPTIKPPAPDDHSHVGFAIDGVGLALEGDGVSSLHVPIGFAVRLWKNPGGTNPGDSTVFFSTTRSLGSYMNDAAEAVTVYRWKDAPDDPDAVVEFVVEDGTIFDLLMSRFPGKWETVPAP